MPIPFWDRYFSVLLDAECPKWPRTDKANREPEHMQLMAYGDAAAMSLAVSLPTSSFFTFVLIDLF